METRVGRNGQDKFWCGFCIKLIKLESHGLDAWEERGDHLEEHFRSGKRVVGSWVPLDKDYLAYNALGEQVGFHILRPSFFSSITDAVQEAPQFENS